jgi:uncharacterized RDD family membrane protein YckC
VGKYAGELGGRVKAGFVAAAIISVLGWLSILFNAGVLVYNSWYEAYGTCERAYCNGLTWDQTDFHVMMIFVSFLVAIIATGAAVGFSEPSVGKKGWRNG